MSLDLDPCRLSAAERSIIVSLSQTTRNLRTLRCVLGIGCTRTLDRIMWGSRRVRPATIAKLRRRLAELGPVVVHRSVQ